MSKLHSLKWRWKLACKKVATMKFSYRITAIGLLCTTIVVVILTWGNDIIMWDDTSHLSTKSKALVTNLPHQQPASLPSRDIAHWGGQKVIDMEELEESNVKDKVDFLVTDKPNEIKPVFTHRLTQSQPSTVSSHNHESCTFSDTKAATVDVDTLEILQLISEGKDPDLPLPRNTKEVEKQVQNFQGYKSANGLPLEVVVVPHSHSDPGWHKTVDGYFESQTRHTLNNMVDKLLKYPKMTFIWAESVFLSLWWQDLEPQMQETVRNLIRRRQLEIVVGSWVVPDEANPHYFALIDQMIEGHQWLEHNVGIKPKNVWTLDPFGYSSTLPYLYQKAGYDNMVILRVHEKVKNTLQSSKALEFNWRQHWDRSGMTDIFTQMMPYKLYNIKHSCGPDPEICVLFDFRRIPGEISESRAPFITSDNIDKQARLLLSQYISKASLFKHNVLLVPVGDDFRYDRNIEWDQQYENYQKLFDYINSQNWNINARFGTIQTYFDELRRTMKALNTSTLDYFPTLSGDFFPYTDQNDEYWTGYFTTRPFDKSMGRELEVNLRAAEVMNSIAGAMSFQNSVTFLQYDNNLNSLTMARQDLALFQHHDGITGTERSWVAVDYEDRLRHGLGVTAEVLKRSVGYILAKDKKYQGDIEALLHITNTKSQRLIQPINNKIDIPEEGIDLILYNSIARAKQELVQVVIDSDSVEVSDENGNILLSQINPVWTFKNTISATVFELVFIADLKPLSLATFNIKAVAEGQKPRNNFASYIRLYNHPGYSLRMTEGTRFQVRPPVGEGIVIENDYIKAQFSASTGFLQSMTTKPVVKTTKTDLKFLMYKSSKSGAYIFGPVGPAVDSELEPKPMIQLVRGPVVTEVHALQELVNHTVRLCNVTGPLGMALEVDNIVDMRDMNEKEMIMHIQTDIENVNYTFFTDQNGFQTMKRQRFLNFPREANYYPFTAYAYLEDTTGRFSILSAQPLGVGSQERGSLEVMLDRRLNYDDMRGLGEGVMDNKRTSSRFYLLLERPPSSYLEKLQQNRRPTPTVISNPSLTAQVLVEDLRYYTIQIFANLDPSLPKVSHYEALTSSLPCDLLLVNMRALNSAEGKNASSAAVLLHRLTYSCDYPARDLSCPHDSTAGPTQVTLGKLFQDLQVTDVTETSLSLMHPKRALSAADQYRVGLNPMDINAYRVQFG